MNQYRIVTDGKRFKIQQKHYWLMWDDLTFFDLNNFKYFDTVKEAENRLEEIKAVGGHHRYQEMCKQTWTSI